LVRPHFELLARLLVDVRRPQHRESFDPSGQRNRAANLGAGAFRGRRDLAGRLIEDTMIERPQSNSDVLRFHSFTLRQAACPSSLCYFRILATTPAPTVRPPSRMAKRRPSSMAIGTMSSTSSCTLSPGMTISLPSGSFTVPVTSVVRK